MSYGGLKTMSDWDLARQEKENYQNRGPVEEGPVIAEAGGKVRRVDAQGHQLPWQPTEADDEELSKQAEDYLTMPGLALGAAGAAANFYWSRGAAVGGVGSVMAAMPILARNRRHIVRMQNAMFEPRFNEGDVY